MTAMCCSGRLQLGVSYPSSLSPATSPPSGVEASVQVRVGNGVEASFGMTHGCSQPPYALPCWSCMQDERKGPFQSSKPFWMITGCVTSKWTYRLMPSSSSLVATVRDLVQTCNLQLDVQETALLGNGPLMAKMQGVLHGFLCWASV